jgi:maleate isomerase
MGHRAKMAALVPSTNTIVEAEYNAMAPDGVTVHAGRMLVPRPWLDSDEATRQLLDDVRAGLPAAIESVMTCESDRVLMAMSAPTFYGGVDGCREWERWVGEQAGMPVTSGPGALLEALERYGAESVAVLSPYQPVNDEQVVGFFEGAGLEIVAYRSVRAGSATGIAEIGGDQLRPLLSELATSDADAVVQVGTNLAMAQLADEAERWLGKPVLPINTATWWSALRSQNIDDWVCGFGSLLRDH